MNPLGAADVRTKRGRDDHRAISLLVLLEDRNQRATNREARAVERVDRTRSLAGRRPVADLGAPRLEVLVVRARGDLAERALAREPDLDVVGLGRAEAEVAGAQGDHSIMKAEALEHRFRIL